MNWTFTEGTYTRHSFHKAMTDVILPRLNPYPNPNSILVLDNAKIHMYKELEDAVHEIGAILIFLPPYSPHLNPIEFAFSSLKAWICKHAYLTFGKYPKEILDIALRECLKHDDTHASLFHNCGYGTSDLKLDIFMK